MKFLSLFSGIEAASVAWNPLGWQCCAVAEIEPFPCAVLRKHYPEVPNLGDVTTITKCDIEKIGPVDIMVGGFPCQDVSIAGKRKGLTHDDGSSTRSGLFFDAMRIAEWADPRWLVIENVPGLFSNKNGRDFATVVGAMAGCEFDVPRGGWRSAGVVVGPRGLVEWCVLDAQYYRLAQRRRRVFLVRDCGDWRNRAPLFLEPYRLQGHPAPRRETRKDIAPTISARTQGGGGLGTDFDLDGGLISHTLLGKANDCLDPTMQTYITSTLMGEGFDAGSDGTSGMPIIPVPFDTTQITSKTNRSQPQAGDPCHPLAPTAHAPAIAFDCKASGCNGFGVGDISPTLRAMSHKDSHSNGGGQIAIAMNLRGRVGGAMPELDELDELASLRAASGGSSRSYVAASAVRRITPREYERLQGFFDDYTLIFYRGKLAADSLRYKALGNSMAVPCMQYIGERIALASCVQRATA